MVIDGECESPFFTSASLFEDIGGLRMRLRRGCDLRRNCAVMIQVIVSFVSVDLSVGPRRRSTRHQRGFDVVV